MAANGAVALDSPRAPVVDESNEPRSDIEAERMYEEALAQALSQAASTEVMADLHFNLGNVRKRLGRENAEKSYREAISLNAFHIEARNNLGVLLTRRGDYERAIEVMEAALGAPLEELARCELEANLGLALEQIGRRQEAVAAYERAISRGSSAAFTNLGSALSRWAEETDDDALRWRALEAHRAASLAAPDDATARFNLAAMLDELGNLEEAVHEYEHAIRVYPAYSDAHNNLALTLEKMRERDPCAASLDEITYHFQVAAEARPDFDVLCNLAAHRFETSQVDLAIDAYRQAADLQPDDAFEAYFRLAEIYASQGYIDNALDCAKRAVRTALPGVDRDRARDFLRDLLAAWRETLPLVSRE